MEGGGCRGTAGVGREMRGIGLRGLEGGEDCPFGCLFLGWRIFGVCHMGGVKIICIGSVHGAKALVYSIIQDNNTHRIVLRHTSVHQKLIRRARFDPTLGLQPKL